MIQRIPEHVARSRALRDLAKRYDAAFQKDRAWTLVLCFYSALHMLEATLRAGARPCSEHRQRLNELKNWEKSNPKLQAAYRWLYDKSIDARYLPNYQPGGQDMTQVWHQLYVVEQQLQAILKDLGVDTSAT